MAPVLPSSLSPHICILPSPDLTDLLASSSLPPLPHILQSFSPLPQVTTRTTSLTSVPHTSFALRFSDLSEIEEACREDEELRAVRTIDWISERINKRSVKWVEDMEKLGDKEILRTPWWDELKRCAEGDHVPSRGEGWNHPVAVILAVSTTAPNPLQAITALHSRNLEFPPWVDPTFLRYTLIIHPQNSPLSDEEAGALFNAVKKQFGLHSYLLPLAMPTPPAPPVPVPALIPRLPQPPSPDSPQIPPSNAHIAQDPAVGNSAHPMNVVNTLRMGEKDIQHTARFAREFVVMSLVPWMEKCVVEWNENFSSTRRLPSRLFSSTRRLFGSPSPSPTPAPAHNPSSSTSSLPARSHVYNGSQSLVTAAGGGVVPPPQQRRLAEFATILGDFKLAVMVWEAMRKEGKGGSDILPLLLAPSLTIPLHAANAISSIHPPTPELPAHAQLRALIYAVRWEIGIGNHDFISNILEGERWFVWAAGNAEEPPSALLLAHAALLSTRKQARRRAALWYLSAANRLEKCGIKSLTMYFLRRAHELYKLRPHKTLSPSFWDSEGKTPSDREGFDAIMSGIEHPLGRLLYTTGDVAGAVRFFLGLLRGSTVSSPSPTPLPVNGNANGESNIPGTDKVFLDDFRVAFTHLKSTAGDKVELADLKVPFTLCVERQTCLRLPHDNSYAEPVEWQKREDNWKEFWKSHGGKEDLAKGGKAAVGETFWLDLVLRNPLDAEVNLSNLTLTVKESDSEDPRSSKAYVEVELIDDLVLGAKELRTIPISVKSRRPALLTITHVTYDFLSLLPSTESLSFRGRRLQDTALQRQGATYAPEELIKVEVTEANHKLLVNFVDDQRLVLAQGESKPMRLWFSNTGTRPISEVWMVAGPEDEFWLNVDEGSKSIDASSPTEVLHSHNSLAPQRPYRIPLTSSQGSPILYPGDSIEFPVVLHAERLGEQELCLLFVYRETETETFHSTRVGRHYEVRPLFDVSVTAQPCHTLDHFFLLNLELENVASSSTIQITQVATLSPTWICRPVAEHNLGPVSPSQSAHLFLGANLWDGSSGNKETVDFVTRKLRDVLHGKTVEVSDPPPIDLLCSHISKNTRVRSVQTVATRHFIHVGRRNVVSRSIADSHPHIPVISYPSIFPLYNPASIDVIVFWEIPSQHRSGHILVPGITLGAGHAALKDIIEEAEGARVQRSMYAETQREKREILDAIRQSEWNVEMNPILVTLQDANTLQHDFSKGSCHGPMTFTLRNYSFTHKSRFVLKLTSDSASYPPPSNYLPPPYSGRLTFRGTIEPSQSTTVRPNLWITRPGTYSLGGWCVETEVCETSPSSGGDLRIRHRYRQEPPLADRSCITVCDLRES